MTDVQTARATEVIVEQPEPKLPEYIVIRHDGLCRWNSLGTYIDRDCAMADARYMNSTMSGVRVIRLDFSSQPAGLPEDVREFLCRAQTRPSLHAQAVALLAKYAPSPEPAGNTSESPKSSGDGLRWGVFIFGHPYAAFADEAVANEFIRHRDRCVCEVRDLHAGEGEA